MWRVGGGRSEWRGSAGGSPASRPPANHRWSSWGGSKLLITNLAHCKEIWIYVFPGKELRGLSPNFHFRVSVSDLYTLFPRRRPTYFPAAEWADRSEEYIWIAQRNINVGIGTVAAQFLSWEYFFRISVLCLCSAELVQIPIPYWLRVSAVKVSTEGKPAYIDSTVACDRFFFSFFCFFWTNQNLYFLLCFTIVCVCGKRRVSYNLSTLTGHFAE